eukprot:Skav218011  [mRNA]  locus=scaffold2344:170347:170835:- [translate_table: standard]
MGNSDCPYPYAVDDHGRYFLFLEKVILEKMPKSEDMPPLGLARDVRDFEPYTYLYQGFTYDKCKFRLRYGGSIITYLHPEMMPFRQPIYEKQNCNGKVQKVSADEFEKLLSKWFKAHGISHLQCHQIQFDGEEKSAGAGVQARCNFDLWSLYQVYGRRTNAH